MARRNGNSEWHSVANVVKFCGIALTVVLAIVSAVSAYYAIVGRIDALDMRMQSQGESLKSLATSIAKLADEALTASDLKAACMQMQIANQGKGWVCPFSGVEVKAPRRVSVTRKTPEAATWSLFGVPK